MVRIHASVRRLPFRAATFLTSVFALMFVASGPAAAQSHRARLSEDLSQQIAAGDAAGSRVILTATRGRVQAVAARHGLAVRKWLKTGAVLDVPAGALAGLAADADVDQLSGDLPVAAHMAVTNVAIGADQVHQDGWLPGMPGLTGKGVGVAVIDSGVANVPELRGRIAVSVDFVDDRGSAHDRNGHGTHVAGIIAAASLHGRGGDLTGVAPGAHIINLRVLDADGRGYASDVIDAIDWAIANRERYGIQVLNLSLGAAVRQSWRDDPLCQAVERAYQAGLVVVASAGNFGKDATGAVIYGGITAPGNSPHAITVGALNTKGTAWRSDDEVASYSSRGPTRFDRLIKPDLVAPGNRIDSLLSPGSTLAKEHPELVVGTGPGARLQLSGTSMAAAVVSGAAAVLKAARRSATPGVVRAITQWSSEARHSGVLTNGAGALNLLSAVASMSQTAIAGESIAIGRIRFSTLPDEGALAGDWDRAERATLVWSDAKTIVWSDARTIVWSDARTIVWSDATTIVWSEADKIVWSDARTIVWSEAETIVWSD